MKKGPRPDDHYRKILQLLKQESRPMPWSPIEWLSPRKTRQARSSHTGKTLKLVLNWGLVEKLMIEGKPRYTITATGLDELARKDASTLLAGSAPFYIQNTPKLVCFGTKIPEDDERKLIEVFRQNPNLRAVGREPPLPVLDVEPVK